MHFTSKTVLVALIVIWTHSSIKCLDIPFIGKGKKNINSDFMKDNPNIPDPVDFLANLLNVTIDVVNTLAKEFAFVNSSAINTMKILVYDENGKYKNYTFTEEIPIDPSDEIKIVIHGWKSQGTAEWVKNITNSYQKLGIKQTIALEWSEIAKENYLKSAGSVENVGTTLGEYIWRVTLKKNKNHLRNIHLIGHSLGAHVSGFFGKYMRKVSGGERVQRISALDAAAPFFEYPIHLPSSKRIDEEDANFVGGYHTNAGFFGFLNPFANQDFYISYGGPVQPGCANIDIIKAFECSHSRSHFVYNLTILTDNYIARHCSSVLLMFSKLCEKNLMTVIGQQNNSTNINGQYFIYVDSDGNPVYPSEEHGLLYKIWNGIRSSVGDVVKTVKNLF